MKNTMEEKRYKLVKYRKGYGILTLYGILIIRTTKQYDYGKREFSFCQ